MVSKISGASVYQNLIRLMMRSKRQMFAASEMRELTPVQGMLLVSMKPGSVRTMNELAEMMGCDASNMTGLIDRLEANDYIERTADPEDRRVKKIQLSDHGCQCRDSLLDELCKAEALDLNRLTDEEVRTLQSIISKLV
jgi:DNA-binding MarR family transcriptional regulator